MKLGTDGYKNLKGLNRVGWGGVGEGGVGVGWGWRWGGLRVGRGWG